MAIKARETKIRFLAKKTDHLLAAYCFSLPPTNMKISNLSGEKQSLQKRFRILELVVTFRSEGVMKVREKPKERFIAMGQS